jgi:hypothetical protein
MKARTTANIELSSFKLLNEVCIIRKTTISKLISTIMNDIITSYCSNDKLASIGTIKYQVKNIEYKQIHFTLNLDLYESGIELRKLNKLSLSFLINDAIKRVLGQTISERNSFSSKSQALFDIFKLLDNYDIKYRILSKSNQNKSCFELKIEIQYRKKEDLTIRNI